jgi:peptidoglycan/xylan/chitin deacetylase (PgdA/CDA1 family)
MSTQSPRYAFEPIIHRAPVRFPNGERLAVLIYVNIEHVPFGSTSLAHAVYPPTLSYSPDILNHGWRDYGNRVGLWRIMEAMDRYGYRGTVNLHSDVCAEYPQIIQEGNARRWEWGAQGDNNTSIATTMSEEQERAFINRNLALIEKATGTRPQGCHRRGLRPHDLRSVRRALRRGPRAAAHHVDLAASLYFRTPVPHEASVGGAGVRGRTRRGLADHGRGDQRLVSRQLSAEGRTEPHRLIALARDAIFLGEDFAHDLDQFRVGEVE